MCMPEMWLILAQLDPNDLEFTAVNLLMGFCVMAVLGGSLVVLAAWWARHSRGESVIPLASRPLPRIPMPLLIFGLLIGITMAAMTLLVRSETLKSAVQPTAPVVENDEVKSGNNDTSGNEVPQTESEVDASADAGGRGVDPESDSAKVPALSSPGLVEVLLHTVWYDIVMIVVLGIPVLLVNRRRTVALMEHVETELSGTGDTLPSTAADPVDGQNPYAVPSTVPATHSQPAGVAQPADDTFVEPWHFGRELRIAAETFLAAWLPTAVLKVTMVMMLPEQEQHPFLQMIMDGVEPLALLLIALTAVILAPLMEELLYRVVILGGLLNHPELSALSASFAIGVTSVLFAIAHGFPDSVALLPLAVAIGWTYYQRRSYRTVVLVHFLFNGFNILIAGLGML